MARTTLPPAGHTGVERLLEKRIKALIVYINASSIVDVRATVMGNKSLDGRRYRSTQKVPSRRENLDRVVRSFGVQKHVPMIDTQPRDEHKSLVTPQSL